MNEDEARRRKEVRLQMWQDIKNFFLGDKGLNPNAGHDILYGTKPEEKKYPTSIWDLEI